MVDALIFIAVSIAFYLSGMYLPYTVILGALAVIYFRVRVLEVKD